MLRFSKASIELYERTGRDRWEGNLLGGEWEGNTATKKSGSSTVEFQSRVLPSERGGRSLRGFEVFCNFQHFGDGVPVAAGAGCVQDFVDARPGELGLTNAVREISVEFAADGVEFFGREFLFTENFAGGIAGIAGQESDQELGGVNVWLFCERIVLDDRAQVVGSAQNDFRTTSKFLFN